MATFYTVAAREIGEKTTADAIKAAGLKKAADITVNGRHAIKYTAGGPYAETEAVLIYEAPGDDFVGQRV